MRFEQNNLDLPRGFFTQTYQTSGFMGCVRKVIAAAKMYIPPLLLGRRTNKSVGAYFDFVTDDGRMLFGDNFHFGFFNNAVQTLSEGLDAHTDMVAEMARLDSTKHALDIGCGICAPAIRIARNYGSRIAGINISREQVRQGRALVAQNLMSDLVTIQEGNALKLDFKDQTFDSILCIEVAGDICVTERQKQKLVDEMHRVLKPGGYIGFSDLVFKGRPTRREEKVMKNMLYHKGRELMTDWPSFFKKRSFNIEQQYDVIDCTMKTWDFFLAIYEQRLEDVTRRYGRRIAAYSIECLREIPNIMEKYGSFLVMSLRKA